MTRNTFLRDRSPDEVPWVRPAELDGDALPRPVILVNGGFDLLHSGHLKLLLAARRKAGPAGTVLLALDGDDKLRRTKGPARPVCTFIERASALGYAPVDFICEINTDRDMQTLVRRARPDARVLGAEYRSRPSRFPAIPRLLVRTGGMRTSRIIERILLAYGHPVPGLPGVQE